MTFFKNIFEDLIIRSQNSLTPSVYLFQIINVCVCIYEYYIYNYFLHIVLVHLYTM